MSRWFRMYTDVLDDPKVQRLPPPLFKVWVNLLCLAGRHDGALPAIEDIAFALRLDEETAAAHIKELVTRGLIDDDDGFSPHNWDNRQFKSDKDETAAERQRKKRDRDRSANVTRDTSVTSHPPETDTDTDTEEDTTSAAPLALDGGNASRPCSAKPIKPAVEADPEGFQDFWDAYPKRDGSPDRKGAVKAFRTALKRASLETILDGTEHFCAAMKARGKAGTEFVPQARTWLNGDRWNERYDAATAADSRQAQNLAILEKYRA